MGLAQCGPFAPRARASAAAPLFTFGIIADVQWMDADDGYNSVDDCSGGDRDSKSVLTT